MELIYNNQVITYEIIKKPIKNVYIHIKEDNVIVSAPKKMKEDKIYELIQSKASWILKTLEKQKQIKERNHGKSEEQRIQEKYNKEDKEFFYKTIEDIMKEYIQKTKLSPNQYRIRNIKTAWGTCSTKKNITINYKLIDKSRKEVEYVVLHELCHLKYMNHSKAFWSFLEQHMPDYKQRRKKLKSN